MGVELEFEAVKSREGQDPGFRYPIEERESARMSGRGGECLHRSWFRPFSLSALQLQLTAYMLSKW